MTTITLKKDKYGYNELRVNGRLISLNGRFENIEKKGSYTWVGTHRGHSFKVWGGINAGGSSNQWYVQYDAIGNQDLAEKSAADCIRLIENC